MNHHHHQKFISQRIESPIQKTVALDRKTPLEKIREKDVATWNKSHGYGGFIGEGDHQAISKIIDIFQTLPADLQEKNKAGGLWHSVREPQDKKQSEGFTDMETLTAY
jgi:hypothetical protein